MSSTAFSDQSSPVSIERVESSTTLLFPSRQSERSDRPPPGPIAVWSFAWLFVVGLSALRLTSNLDALDIRIAALLLAMPISARLFATAPPRDIAGEQKFRMMGALPTVTTNAACITLWTISIGAWLASDGIPLQRFLLGESLDHKASLPFGLGGLLLGILLALAATITSSVSLGLSTTKITKSALLWPIVALNRLSLVLICAMAVVAVVRRVRVKPRTLLRIGVLTILFVVAMGQFAANRTSQESLRDLPVEGWKSSVFENLPSGALWLYVYTTSPLGNLDHNLDRHDSGELSASVATLLPRALRTENDAKGKLHRFELEVPQLTTATGFSGIHSDFGILGSVTYSILLGAVASHLYRRSQIRPSVQRRAKYLLFCTILAIWVFDDLLLRPYTVTAFILISAMAHTQVTQNVSQLGAQPK